MHAGERRRARRFPLELHGHAIVRGKSYAVKTQDVSVCGGLVHIPIQPEMLAGTRIRIRLDMQIRGMALVCRSVAQGRRTLYGIRFDRFDGHSDLTLLAFLARHEQGLLQEQA